MKIYSLIRNFNYFSDVIYSRYRCDTLRKVLLSPTLPLNEREEGSDSSLLNIEKAFVEIEKARFSIFTKVNSQFKKEELILKFIPIISTGLTSPSITKEKALFYSPHENVNYFPLFLFTIEKIGKYSLGYPSASCGSDNSPLSLKSFYPYKIALGESGISAILPPTERESVKNTTTPPRRRIFYFESDSHSIEEDTHLIISTLKKFIEESEKILDTLTPVKNEYFTKKYSSINYYSPYDSNDDFWYWVFLGFLFAKL